MDKKKKDHSRRIETGGGAYIEGGVDTGSGDFVGRDKSVYQGAGGEELAALFAALRQQVGNLPAAQKAAVVGQIAELEEEIAKGDEADPDTVGDLVQSLVNAAPDLIEGLVSIFTSSLVSKAVGSVARFILKRAHK